ncbi:MAG: exodeoxyribonuclease III [Bdellovibrionales bacterium]|nr:exodeoxyribonuclease III [Bdellovibrionales bacterium]
MKLASWNVNGLRACARNGFRTWFEGFKPDIVGLQEIKVRPDQLIDEGMNDLVEPPGYLALWNPAQKPGYSGTAIYTKLEPYDVRQGFASAYRALGLEPAPASALHGFSLSDFDAEGRVLIAEFKDWVFITAYFPNSQPERARINYKLGFCRAMWDLCDAYTKRGTHTVLCGDYNIAHREIDLKNPKCNVDNAGFLPEERAEMDEYLGRGYADVFRERVKDEPHHYSWWSYRSNARANNVGWRIDYHCVDRGLVGRVADAGIQPQVLGSDHCPVTLDLRA